MPSLLWIKICVFKWMTIPVWYMLWCFVPAFEMKEIFTTHGVLLMRVVWTKGQSAASCSSLVSCQNVLKHDVELLFTTCSNSDSVGESMGGWTHGVYHAFYRTKYMFIISGAAPCVCWHCSSMFPLWKKTLPVHVNGFIVFLTHLHA